MDLFSFSVGKIARYGDRFNATLYAVFAASARRLLASPRAQRGFSVAGGTLLSAAGLWALLARAGARD